MFSTNDPAWIHTSFVAAMSQISSEIGPGKVVASETLCSILNAPPCQNSGSIIKSGFLPSNPCAIADN